ncbi:MAG: alpha/beta hydrolase [Clostridiales bacterium]|jgi:pimeloyl-ACP methyl ester carboxylesterase|nr:alpha/beta hydrolase [Clostridiales bacterium]
MINHVIKGADSGTDIIFLHGFGGGIISFAYAARCMSKSCRTTLVDLYGFGETPHMDRPMDLNDYVKSVEEIIRYYVMKNVILVAHSFGGRVAIKLKAEGNDAVKKLVLCDSAGILPKRTSGYYIRVYIYKLLKKLRLKPNMGSADYKGLPEIMKKTFINIVNYDLKPCLRDIDCPTLIVWGEKDRETPMYMAEILNKNIRGSRLVVFEGCGHFAYIEDGYRFTKLLRGFVNEESHTEAAAEDLDA